MRPHHLLCLAGAAFVAASLTAGEPSLAFKPLMTEPGKLLFSDDFSKPLGKEWRTGKGKWEIVGGALQGSELKADKHGAVTRHEMPFGNVIIQVSFKLDGAKLTTLSINKAKAHLCRVRITPTDLVVQKDDQDGKNGPDKAVVLDSRKTTIATGEWRTLLLELLGNEMVASLDGKEVVFGTHSTLEAPKANFGLTVAGESASFKNLRVWEASPNKNWPAIRAKLRQK